ncbi:recombinase family protein [Nakamurella flava]|uniref:Recombinase family protein n=1 Tax=Nakamurella flava TaxID=2576308 RepID=A0A4U6QMM3_9ACTN|nr:recombinase family protein [Nakamurella flava]TKV61336.1 recombinase family protein [Nakamurella flava]
MTADLPAGIYARISSDDEGLGLGVQRQITDCRTEAQRRGWTVTSEYVDNDVSATRSKVRPEYQRMLRDVVNGRIKAVVVWDVDRLTRTPRELEDVIDLADRQGLALASVGGDIDLSTPQGRLTARLKGSVARHETEQQSRRLRRKFDDRAAEGRRHGRVPYGYAPSADGPDQLDPHQAGVIALAAKMLLAGQSLRAVTAELNRRGEPTPRGSGVWTSTQLRQVLLRPRNAGLRVHRGSVLGPGDWPPVYDVDVHDRVLALLTDPTRRTSRGAERKHLLSGLAICGRCGDDDIIVNVGRKSRGKTQPPAYVCRSCTRVRRKQAAVDEVVEGVVVARLQLPDALAVLAAGDPLVVESARAEAAALEARLGLAADQFADGAITGDQLQRISAKLRPQIDHAKERMNAAMPTPGMAELAGVDAGSRWSVAPLEVRRAVIDALCTVTIMPAGPGKPFDPESVRIQWRSS